MTSDFGRMAGVEVSMGQAVPGCTPSGLSWWNWSKYWLEGPTIHTARVRWNWCWYNLGLPWWDGGSRTGIVLEIAGCKTPGPFWWGAGRS